MAVDQNQLGEIRGDAAYPIEKFKKLVGISKDGMRSAKRAGLKVRRVHRRAYVMGADWLEYLRQAEADADQS